MRTKEEREQIVELYKQGKSDTEISKLLLIPRRTIYNIILRFKENLNLPIRQAKSTSDKRERKNKSSKERKNKYFLIGKCSNHRGTDIVQGKTYCQECLNNFKIKAKLNVSNGKCRSHQDRNFVQGTTYCQECLDDKSWRRILHKYNITKEQYFIECEKRNYKCDICSIACKPLCSQSKPSEMFAIDHDHKTGLFRGLLCYTCNISLTERLITNLENIIAYLLR